MDFLRSFSDEEEIIIPKKKDPGFDVKEKIKELMKRSSPINSYKLAKSFKHSSKQKRGDINKGVGHGIKRPKFTKAKEKHENKAKRIIGRMKEVRLPPRYASNRSPVKPGKHKRHMLSCPGTSLLDSPDSSSQEDDLVKDHKFFTSRSKTAAVFKVNETIRFSSMNGEITMNERKSFFEKKNIGRVIELELEKKIAAASLQSPQVNRKLENVSKLPSFVNSSTPPKPTRFASSPSPRKAPFVFKGTPLTRSSPRRQTIELASNTNPVRRTSPRKSSSDSTFIAVRTPQKQRLNSSKSTPTRTSPRKHVSSSSISTPSRNTSPKKQVQSSSISTPKRTSPRKQFLKTINVSTPPKSPRNSPYRRTKEQDNDDSNRTPVSSSKSPIKGNFQYISPSKKKSLLKSMICAENYTQQNVDNTETNEEDYEDLENNLVGNEDTVEENILEDMEAAFNQMESSSEEDQILSNILKENQSPNKVESPRKSSRKKSPNKENSVFLSKAERSPNKINEKVRYFPVFESKKCITPSSTSNKPLNNKNSNLQKKKFIAKKLDRDQMIIDAGQKEFGATFCKECGTLYEVGNPEDEDNHAKAHANVTSALRFNGWKNERQVTHMDRLGGRVIQVVHTDNSQWWRKVQEVLKIVDEDLGFSESSTRCISNTIAFLYIMEKQIAGILIAESIENAFRIIQDPKEKEESHNKLICCSETPVRVAFGISRIWVSAAHRKRGIATKLVDAMRANLLSFHYLTVDEIAFSDPTQSGMCFAEMYTKKTDFLVYRRE